MLRDLDKPKPTVHYTYAVDVKTCSDRPDEIAEAEGNLYLT